MRYFSIALLVIAGVYYFTQLQQADRGESGAIVSEGNIDAFQLRVGDCFNDDGATEETAEVIGVAGVPCNQPHDNEVFAVFDTSLSEFPGIDVISETAYTECVARFEAFVGREYETSQLDVFPMYPTAQSWSELDDRGIICALYDLDLAKLEGSMRGSGI